MTLCVATFNADDSWRMLSSELPDWLDRRGIDVLCLQEDAGHAAKDLVDAQGLRDWNVTFDNDRDQSHREVAMIWRKGIECHFASDEALPDSLKSAYIEVDFSGVTVVVARIPRVEHKGDLPPHDEISKYTTETMVCLEQRIKGLVDRQRFFLVAGEFRRYYPTAFCQEYVGQKIPSSSIEKMWVQKMIAENNLVDVYERLKSDKRCRNIYPAVRTQQEGYRVNFQLTNNSLADKVIECVVDYEVGLSTYRLPLIVKYDI